jgi:hypothetical protein
MAQDTSSILSDHDATQILQKVYNPAEGTLAVGSFVNKTLGNNIQVAYPNATTETYSFYEGTTPNFVGPTLLFTLTVVYTDSTKANLLSVTRTA